MKNFLTVSYYFAVMLMIFSLCFMVSGVCFYFLKFSMFMEWTIVEISGSSIIMLILLDWMSLMFAGLVMLISSMVLFYSYEYMSGDKHMYRFIVLVYLFVGSMLFMILSPNMVSILLGWDGLGLVSYCLVIYYQNAKSAAAGMVTILSNRIGDVAILLSIAWLLNFGSWNVFYTQFMYLFDELKFLVVLVILAAMTKSAQMPFSAWLPAAMAAPTPVSALVHSSTLVTAGVYLLIRFNYIIGLSDFLFFVGVMTMFMSGLGANYENDLKKIIALSTLSQLGLMMMTLGLGLMELSFFHLLTHAMFKSLLFLCAGVFIHSMGDTQDIRMMGGLLVACPVTVFYFIGSSLALCGFPFLSGFYSKDAILELFFMGHMNFMMYMIIFLATMFTLSYSVRLIYYILFNNLSNKSLLNLSETHLMLIPMSVLMVLAVVAGGYLSVFMIPIVLVVLPFMFKLSVLTGLSFIFVFLLNQYNLKKINMPNLTGLHISFTGSMWFLPYLTTILIVPVTKWGSSVMKFVDQGWTEYSGGQGFVAKYSAWGVTLDLFNSLNMKMYIYMFMLTSIIMMVFIL